MRLLAVFYGLRPYKLACKVISVGNITLGGTGKTPLVEYIARLLKERGQKVAVLTRGYKGGRGDLSDEPLMLQNNLKGVPVIINPDRLAGAKEAMGDYGVNTVILDDGFQQWWIKKDLEVAVIDSTNPFGNSHVLPRGILREPLSSLRRADIFVLTKTDLAADTLALRDYLTRVNDSAVIVESRHAPGCLYALGDGDEMIEIQALKGKNAALISGIGDPASFEQTVKRLGIHIELSFRFNDHHYYSQKDFDNIFTQCRQKNIVSVITTEKDAARLSGFPIKAQDIRVWVLGIKLVLTKNEEGFSNRLFGIYNP
ncbi:MAG: tetraacyldisaccharide 4'-kinase [Candidatus Omnitrophica bacterium]|nr:tetraacyldisaccharide 4'-kinase [Candidatus Omnitrophota bacterium]